MPLLQDGARSDGAPGSKAFGNHSPQTPSGLVHTLDACNDFITVLGLSLAAAARGDAQGMTKGPSTRLKPQYVARCREE